MATTAAGVDEITGSWASSGRARQTKPWCGNCRNQVATKHRQGDTLRGPGPQKAKRGKWLPAHGTTFRPKRSKTQMSGSAAVVQHRCGFHRKPTAEAAERVGRQIIGTWYPRDPCRAAVPFLPAWLRSQPPQRRVRHWSPSAVWQRQGVVNRHRGGSHRHQRAIILMIPRTGPRSPARLHRARPHWARPRSAKSGVPR